MLRRVRVLLVVLLVVLPAVGGENRSKKELLAALASPNYQVKRKAVLAVEGRTEPELLDRLLAVATSDPNSNIRGFAAEVLGTFRDPRVFPVLARMAQEEEYGTRTSAYVGLGKLGDPRGRRVLLDGLAAGRGLRGYAAQGLGLLGDPEGFGPVARAYLKHTDDPYLVELAPEALVRILKPDGLAFLRKQFVALPRHARPAVARVLGRHPDEKTRRLMEGLLKSDDRTVRLPAIQVLSAFADRKSTPALLAHLARTPEDRTEVIEALGRARDPQAAAPLLATLKKEGDLVAKMRLIEALGRVGDKRAIDVLKPMLHDTTLLPQPRGISAVYGFPWSTRVHAAAAWAVLTIRDGKEPFPVADLSVFPTGEPPPHVAKAIAAARGR